MAFNDLISKYASLLVEQEPAATQDATAPAPQAAQPEAIPKSKEQTVTVPPEGYVDMVRLLAKALVMNVPAGSIDALFTTPITRENATAVREGLQDAINTNENYADNPQKIEDPHVQHFINSINENNFMAKYKQILAIMKNYSNDPRLK
jgi:hypothetical protein